MKKSNRVKQLTYWDSKMRLRFMTMLELGPFLLDGHRCLNVTGGV